MQLAHLQTPWYNVKVKHTFIELDDSDQQGNDCAAKVGCRSRAFSDPGEITESSYNPNELDFCDKFAEDESLDAQSTCSRTTDSLDTGDDDVASLSWSSSPVQDFIASPRSCLSHGTVSSEPPCDVELHPALSAVPVYSVFFTPVLMLCPRHAGDSIQPRHQQGAAASAVHQKPATERTSLGGASSCTSMAKEVAAEGTKKLTTITFKNVPADCTLSHVLGTLDREGYAGYYDFVHAPVDLGNKSSLGYVHINLLNHVLAERVYHHFQGFRSWLGPCKACDISGCIANWSEGYQGLAAFIERYRNSPLMHSSVPQEYKPALFSNGARVRFPAPTLRLKPPRVRHQKRGGLIVNTP